MLTPRRNHSISTTASDCSPAQYKSFEAPYKSFPVRSAGYQRLSFRRSQSSSRSLGLNSPNADGVAIPSLSPSVSVLYASPPPDSPASTMFGGAMFRRSSTQSNISSASTDYSRRGSAQSSLSPSASLEFWSTFRNTLAANTTDPEFHNARLVHDALVEAFPNGLPELESCALRGPADVHDYAKEIMSAFWCCRNCYPLKSFGLQVLHNSPMIKMEEVDCGEGMIADFAVTLDNLGRKCYWPMAHPRVCPCGGDV